MLTRRINKEKKKKKRKRKVKEISECMEDNDYDDVANIQDVMANVSSRSVPLVTFISWSPLDSSSKSLSAIFGEATRTIFSSLLNKKR